MESAGDPDSQLSVVVRYRLRSFAWLIALLAVVTVWPLCVLALAILNRSGEPTPDATTGPWQVAGGVAVVGLIFAFSVGLPLVLLIVFVRLARQGCIQLSDEGLTYRGPFARKATTLRWEGIVGLYERAKSGGTAWTLQYRADGTDTVRRLGLWQVNCLDADPCELRDLIVERAGLTEKGYSWLMGSSFERPKPW